MINTDIQLDDDNMYGEFFRFLPNQTIILFPRWLGIITHHVLYELRSVTSDRLDGLENVHLAVLDHLFDTGVGRAVHAASASAITETTRAKDYATISQDNN